jgi:hypothetical protein
VSERGVALVVMQLPCPEGQRVTTSADHSHDHTASLLSACVQPHPRV